MNGARRHNVDPQHQTHMKSVVAFLLLLTLGNAAPLAQGQPAATQPWPHSIPCRVHDGDNPDLFVMTLGPVQTPIADGIFDPVHDLVTLKNRAVTNHYYRDALGIKYYQPLDKSRFPLPPSGWCTWYYYYSRISETEVKRNAEWLAANLKDYGARYVQIDDGWQGTGDAGTRPRDWTTINREHFPDRMTSLASRIKSLGLTPALWIAPHGQSSRLVVSNNPNVFLLKPDGTTATNTWEGWFLVDPSTPESLTYLRNLFTRLSGWGYEYFKIDGQTIVIDQYALQKQYMRHPSEDTDGLYRKTIESIRGAIGPDRYLLGCWGIPLDGVGIMNGSRTGGDVVLGWGGFQVALRPTLNYYFLHNIAWYCDPDVMLVRSPLTLDQARAWATLEGLTGQALMSSDRLMDLGEDRVELLRRVYPATDIRPLDLFPTERYKRIWDLKVNHLGRNYDVVGVFNFSQQKAERTLLRWADLGLPAGQLVHVYDFWNKDYLGAWPEGIVVDAAPTSCRVLTLVPATDRIQLISTSRHITQGWVDLVSLTWNAHGPRLEGLSKVVKDDPYQLRFAFPRGTNYVIKRASARSSKGKLPVNISNHQGWATLQIVSSRTAELGWDVEFEPADYFHYQPTEPAALWVERVGLNGVNLHWREQYYLNAGYQVYLNGKLQGYTPLAEFPLRHLDPHADYTIAVKTVAEDGTESRRAAETKFNLASLVPAEVSLTDLEPAHTTGRWSGFEIEDLPTGAPLNLGGKHYERGLGAFVPSQIEFDVDGLYDTFTALVGLDASAAPGSAAEFVVLGDGKELGRSGAMSTTDRPKPVELNITGVRRLVLRITGPDGRKTRAQADWAEPKVTRKVNPPNP